MAGKNEYGKKKKGKTKNTKSPIDDFDSDLGDGIQLSLPIKKAKLPGFDDEDSMNAAGKGLA